MSVYERFLRPVLFRLPAETVHHSVTSALRFGVVGRLLAAKAPVSDRLEVDVGGLHLANPVGLSAGFDKDAEALSGLQHFGFGCVTVGSILPGKRPGNPKPRLVRYPEERALGNCYGLPSDGVAVCADRLRRANAKSLRMPVVANIDAPNIAEYIHSFELIEPLVNGIELGLQCPNNAEDRGEMHELDNFENLLREITKRRTKPLFVKLAFPGDSEAMQNRLQLAEIAAKYGVDGINVPGIFKRPEPGVSMAMAAISGKPAFPRTLSIIKELSHATKGRVALKANGGVMTGRDVLEVLMAGASMVDVLSAFIYRGWSAANEINRELLAAMDENGVRTLASLKTHAVPMRARDLAEA